jgi:hypothetical protein
MAHLERLVRGQQDVIARQQERIAQLEGRQADGAASAEPAYGVASGEVGAGDAVARGTVAQSSSRRTLLKLGGAAAAAGVAAAAAAVTSTGTAQAHYNQDMVFNGTGAGHFAAEGAGTTGAIGLWGTSDTSFGVLAQSSSGTGGQGQSSSGIGLLGLSTSGNGVAGTSSNAYGGSFQGGLAPVFLQPGSGSGAPSSGLHQKGELFVDVLGTLWVCTGAGTPGSWVRQVGVLAGPPASATTLQLTASGSGGIAFEGDGSSGAIGLKGTADSGQAIIGVAASGHAVVGTSTSGYGGVFAGGLSPLQLTPGGSAGAPASGAHLLGEIYVDIGGILWSCTGSGTPGTWVQLTPASSGTPHGVLTYLSAPIRIFDSRSGQPAPLPSVKSPLVGGSTYTIQVTGTSVNSISVPSGATGAFGNLTVTNTQNAGDLILWPHGAPQPLTSNINYVGGQTVANSFNVGLSSGGAMDLFVHVSGTDAIIDIAGYIM